MTAEEVLRRLAAGQPVSGAALAAEFSVTRAAVWKQVQNLRALGVAIGGEAGSGYQLEQPLELLDAARLAAALSPASRAALRGLELRFSIDSSNAELKRRAPGSAHGVALFAEHQSAGRGRRGRAWHSPLASNLYLSLGWRFAAGAGGLAGLSLATGVAVQQALQHCGVPGAALKWPNDVVADGRKLAGVLIDIGGEFAGPCDVVIGVGLNFRMASGAQAIDQPWIDVASLCAGQMPTRPALAAALLDALLRALQEFERGGFAPFAAAFERHDALRGREVTVSSEAGAARGIACGIDGNGLLLVEIDGQSRRFAGGEVSVRATP